MRNAQIFQSVAWLLLIFGLFAGNATAIGLSDFTSNMSNPGDGLGDAKPIMMEVIAIVIGLFLVTCALAVFIGGTTANIGGIVHNVSIRSRGITGVVTVLAVVFVVIVTLLLFFHLYNKYLTGAA